MTDMEGLKRVMSKERHNESDGGRGMDAGYANKKKRGPASGGSNAGNPTQGGGINRATKGMK